MSKLTEFLRSEAELYKRLGENGALIHESVGPYARGGAACAEEAEMLLEAHDAEIRSDERKNILTALETLCQPNWGAAVAAVAGDYPELVALIKPILARRAEAKTKEREDLDPYTLDPWVEESFRSSLNANRSMFGGSRDE